MGGIANFGTLTIAQSSVGANTATSGAGIYNGDALSISNSKLNGNAATNRARWRVFSAFGTLSIERSMLSGNSASSGGGILTIGGSASVTASTVSGNSAAFDGGGIYNESAALMNPHAYWLPHGHRVHVRTTTCPSDSYGVAVASSTVRLPGAQSRS